MSPSADPHRYVGTSIQRIDAVEKATGAARFVHDMAVPGMLHAATLTSPHAAARIAEINVDAARAVPGVRAVLTGVDLSQRVGLYLRDKPILARDVVRYQGEPVAAVAADDLAAARTACERIRVNYEPLPAVLDPHDALGDGAPLVHPDLASYEYMREVFSPKAGSNVAHHQKIRKGDTDAAIAGAQLVVRREFYNPPVQHVPLETHAVIAQSLPGQRMVVHSSCQSPYTVRHLLSVCFGIPHGDIRVLVPYVGGGFGGKAGLHLEPLAYCLSRAARGRPVKLVATREEEFNTLPSRQGLASDLTLAVTEEGRIVALKAIYVWDSGAYADYGVNVGRAAAYSGAGPYEVPNCHIDSLVVYTNKVFGTAYRGFGHLEVLWGIERLIDIAAREAGLDPLEFRRRNLLREGATTITGETFTAGHGDPEGCLRAAAEGIEWDAAEAASPVPRGKARGRGIAMLHKAPAMPTNTSCAAIIKLDEDGAADVLISGVDYGQGTYTTLRQIAADELRLPIERVRITWDCDTASMPYDWQTVASRFAFMGGNAVIEAASDCLQQLRETAGGVFGVEAEDVVCESGTVYPSGHPDRAIPYERFALGYMHEDGHSVGGPIIGRGRYIAKGLTHLDRDTGQGRPALFWTYGAHAVEVEVDLETGDVEVLRIATALDAGKVLNPKLCEGQVAGGVIQGLGSALLEGFRFDDHGRLLNPSFVDYKIPTAKDIPREMRRTFLETPQPGGPYGARGIAEHPMVSVPSAIGNALYDALGVDYFVLPLTGERVLQGILDQGGSQ